MVWSQSHFLQSLGWATLNSFWQMALLWCAYVGTNVVFPLSSARKYQISVIAIITGFGWFIFTFFHYFTIKTASGIVFFNQSISESNSFLNTFLISASVAYLSLLAFPTYRLFKNWQFVQCLKKDGLQKADFTYRLFVQKISAQLGISKKTFVYVSALVKSPVTVGFLKPMILLPVALLSNLSLQQAEAVLLHELSHIRRCDYLVNFMLSIISTFLYFNPFVKLFIKDAEEERENCCDQLVLQYGYDKVSYASALLTLEKISSARHVLALGATGKSYLLKRIEKIIGVENKKGFKRNQFAGLLAALLCIVLFNSVLFIEKKKQDRSNTVAYSDFSNTLNFFELKDTSKKPSTFKKNQTVHNKTLAATEEALNKTAPVQESKMDENNVSNNLIINAASDDVENSLTKEQISQVKSAVDATRKVYGDLQWQEVEKVIGDAMTEQEKAKAKQEYLKALQKAVDWKNIEQNMKTQYEKLDWEKINTNVTAALGMIQLDSLQKVYSIALTQLNKLTEESKTRQDALVCPLPDQSVEALAKAKAVLSNVVNTIKAVRSNKKIVRL